MHALTYYLPGLAVVGLALIVLVWLLVLRLRSLLRWARELTEWDQEQEDREMCQRCTDYDCGATCFARQLAEP